MEMSNSSQQLELDEPLLSTQPNIRHDNSHELQMNNTNGLGITPRILDRDGTFSQSRGRWSVANTTSITGTRQRRPINTTPPSAAFNQQAAIPHGITSDQSSQQSRPHDNNYNNDNHSVNNTSSSICCLNTDNPLQPLSPRRCWDDWFHTISDMPTCILVLGVFTAYFITIVIFAGLYLTVNKVGIYYDGDDSGTHGSDTNLLTTEENDMNLIETSGDPSFCGMDINNHMEALYFSLSTMATIGYGTSDYYFGECWTPFILVLLQVFSAIVFSSLAIGLLFQRMSRGQKRGRTIVFSDVAVIRKVRGQWYWMFRVAELRKRHIIGAKIRVFCVRHERCPVSMIGDYQNGRSNTVELETAHFVSHPLPLLNGSSQSTPYDSSSSEDFEQSILMGLPHVVVHRMDNLSPMVPPRPVWYDERGVPHGVMPETQTTDQQTGDDKQSSLLMEEGQSGALSSPNIQQQSSQEELTHFLQDRQAEIICFLEGTCETTGMALQARHSYRIEDVAFHQTFAPCVYPASSSASSHMTGKKKWWKPFRKNKAKVDQDDDDCENVNLNSNAALEIDFTQFHDLMPAPMDSMSCPYIPLSSVR